jgi:hypothetical protein
MDKEAPFGRCTICKIPKVRIEYGNGHLESPGRTESRKTCTGIECKDAQLILRGRTRGYPAGHRKPWWDAADRFTGAAF